MILAIGVTVRQQDNLAHRQAADDQVSRRDFQGFFEVGAAPRLKTHNLLLELSAVHAQRMQTRDHVGLRIKGDDSDVVAVVELAQQRDCGLLGVADPLAIANRRIARVVAHRIGAVDTHIDAQRFAAGRRGLRNKPDGKGVFQRALLEVILAQDTSRLR